MTEQKVVFIAGSSVSRTKIKNPAGIGISSTHLKSFREYCKGNLANLMEEGRDKVLRYCLVFGKKDYKISDQEIQSIFCLEKPYSAGYASMFSRLCCIVEC